MKYNTKGDDFISRRLNHLIQYSPIYYTVPNYQLIYIDEEFRALTKSQLPIITEAYMISNYGRVFNKYTNHMMTPQIGTDGYYAISLSTDIGYKRFRINRLVMITFNPINDVENFVVNHLDCNPTNNHISNLEWTTRTGNAIHAYDNGLMKYGEDGPTSKISKEIAINIAKLLSTNMTFKQIADTVGGGATPYIVQNIYIGHGWNRDLQEYIPNFRKKREKVPQSYVLSDDFCHDICKFFVQYHYNINNYYTINDYCEKALKSCNEKYNIPVNESTIKAVYDVFTRRTHKKISDLYQY